MNPSAKGDEMSTMKMLGFAAAALLCLGRAQPVSAADCPASPAQGAEEIMSRVPATANGQDTKVTDAAPAEARSDSSVSTPRFPAANGGGHREQALPCMPGFCCFELPLSGLVCCVTPPFGVFCS
jgi:hypothetical protein